MSILIASDCRLTAIKLQKALTQFGQNCQMEHLVSIDQSVNVALGWRTSLRLVLFVLSENRTRALQQVQALRSKSEVILAVVGPALDPNSILDALHCGADHFIDSNGDLSIQIQRCLHRKLRSPLVPTSGKLIAVISPCGGSGVSVIAANLAASVAQQTQSCALLDFQIGRGDQAALFNLSPRHHLNDLCGNLDSFDQNMLDQSFTHHSSGVRLLAANEETLDLDRAYQIGLRKICQIAKQSSPCSFIDYPMTFHEDRIGVLRECDSILVAVRPDFTSLKNLGSLMIYLSQLNIDPAIVHVVANRVGTPQELPISQFKFGTNRKIELTIDDAPHLINGSVNCGSPAVLGSPQSLFARSIQRVSRVVYPTESAPSHAHKSRWGIESLRSRIFGQTKPVPHLQFATPAM